MQKNITIVPTINFLDQCKILLKSFLESFYSHAILLNSNVFMTKNTTSDL